MLIFQAVSGGNLRKGIEFLKSHNTDAAPSITHSLKRQINGVW